MADDISIKLATSEDAAAVLQFLRVIDLINQFDDCVILLAMLSEEIVGMVTVMVLDHQPTTGELGVVVRKKYWRNGIGRLLVDEAEYWFNTYSSLENLVLTVFEDNIPAIKLYQQLHFVTTGKTVEQGRNVLQMQYDNKKEETMEK